EDPNIHFKTGQIKEVEHVTRDDIEEFSNLVNDIEEFILMPNVANLQNFRFAQICGLNIIIQVYKEPNLKDRTKFNYFETLLLFKLIYYTFLEFLLHHNEITRNYFLNHKIVQVMVPQGVHAEGMGRDHFHENEIQIINTGRTNEPLNGLCTDHATENVIQIFNIEEIDEVIQHITFWLAIETGTLTTQGLCQKTARQINNIGRTNEPLNGLCTLTINNGRTIEPLNGLCTDHVTKNLDRALVFDGTFTSMGELYIQTTFDN
ncbi:hypothetical protein ACJX0J_042042, partial [Zea mays]